MMFIYFCLNNVVLNYTFFISESKVHIPSFLKWGKTYMISIVFILENHIEEIKVTKLFLYLFYSLSSNDFNCAIRMVRDLNLIYNNRVTIQLQFKV